MIHSYWHVFVMSFFNNSNAILFALVFYLSLSDWNRSTFARRRYHRFIGNRTEPSPAYTTLLGKYAPNGHYFGNVIVRINSDATKTPRIVLNNNQSMPLVGFGTYQLGTNVSANRETIKDAIDAGYRLIDTAYLYNTEQEIGDVLAKLLASGQLKRDDIFITTKVWPTHFSKNRVLQSIRESLAKLKLAYVDLVLLHFPTGFKDGKKIFPTFKNGTVIPRTWRPDAYLETWEAMETAVYKGLTRSIGVSNFNRNQIWKLLRKAKIKPVVNQVESHPFFKQEALRKYMLKNRIIMQAYAPLRVADKDLLQHATLRAIGRAHNNKTAAQVALRWQLDRTVPLVVKSSNPGRMAANIELFDFTLTPSEMANISAIKQKPRIYTMTGIESHPDYPFDQE